MQKSHNKVCIYCTKTDLRLSMRMFCYKLLRKESLNKIKVSLQIIINCVF